MKQAFFFVVCLLNITSLFGSTAEEGLKSISLHEKICMRHFFDFAIKMDYAAHVLCFENKPACFTGVVIRNNGRRTFKEILCLQGWLAFRKHEHLFPHPNFIFSEEMYEGEELKSLDIFIINKRAVQASLDEHLALFKDELGPDFSPERFVAALDMGQPLPALIDRNEVLLGILLGYGTESAQAYQDAQSGGKISDWTDTYCSVDGKQPKGCKIFPIAFMGDPNSPQVLESLSIYDEELREIWAKYRQIKDPLRMVLEQICADL